uniref:Uncharacterized protein n=1 Tax=Noctiluca scintillans TaxID=2966 RepID=A0A7S1AG14_NOCSC|mmetsp:Transcript_44472/g.118091  ORF Transcript_44472/g.118091 Transcript_44472/m.118091 type:complete len:147 (+) Transcript_44472:35-475(+)
MMCTMMQDGCGFFLTPPLHPQLQEEVSAEFSRMDATDIDVELPRLPFASHLASFGKHQQSTSDFFAHATAVEIRSQFAALEERTARKPRESRHVSELEETIARFDTQLVADQELAETPRTSCARSCRFTFDICERCKGDPHSMVRL